MVIKSPSLWLLALALALLATTRARAESPLQVVPRATGLMNSTVRGKHWQKVDWLNTRAVVSAGGKEDVLAKMSEHGYRERRLGAHPGQDFSLVKELPDRSGEQVHVVFYRVSEQVGRQLENLDEQRQRWAISAHQEPSSTKRPLAHVLSAVTGREISYRAGTQQFLRDFSLPSLRRLALRGITHLFKPSPRSERAPILEGPRAVDFPRR